MKQVDLSDRLAESSALSESEGPACVLSPLHSIPASPRNHRPLPGPYVLAFRDPRWGQVVD